MLSSPHTLATSQRKKDLYHGLPNRSSPLLTPVTGFDADGLDAAGAGAGALLQPPKSSSCATAGVEALPHPPVDDDMAAGAGALAVVVVAAGAAAGPGLEAQTSFEPHGSPMPPKPEA